ncbi:MAG: PAS domain S-box protein [Candidatus Aminicenantes bacterium]|nr:PAS domain S-box protein [Candidatus Aminicenantes bacterium]
MNNSKKTKAQLIEELQGLRTQLQSRPIVSSGKTNETNESQWEKDMGRQYIDIAGVIILALNREGEITLINKKGCELLGFPDKDLIGKNWFDCFLPARVREEVKTVFSRLMAGEIEPIHYHINPILEKGGSERIIAWYNTLKKDEKGTTIGIISSGEDITSQKQVEVDLRESEEKYKTLIRTSPDAVTVMDLDGFITYVSDQMLKIHGYSQKEDLLGKSAFDLIALEDRIKARLNVQRTIKQGLVTNVEYCFLHQDGSRFIGELNASVIRDSADQPKMLITTTRDITEKKKAEEELRKSLNDKDLLLQEIHHRVKNNLQVISSLLDMTDLQITDSRCSSLITNAIAKIQTMTFIHSQLYQSDRYDRIEMGTHVRELINYLTILYGTGKKFTSHVRINKVYLPLTQAIPCALVLNELISNAFKHAFASRKEGTVEVKMDLTEDDRVKIRVRDDGIGMDENFDLKETTSQGLKLVRNLVEKQLKGTIRIQKDRFTEFFIQFFILQEEKQDVSTLGRR